MATPNKTVPHRGRIFQNSKTTFPFHSTLLFKKRDSKSCHPSGSGEGPQQYKKEIQDLRQFTSLGLTDLQDQINKIVVNQENLEEVPKSSQVNNEATDSYLNIFQRWKVSLTIVIKDKFVLNINALIDSGAALNCVQKGLVPT